MQFNSLHPMKVFALFTHLKSIEMITGKRLELSIKGVGEDKAGELAFLIRWQRIFALSGDEYIQVVVDGMLNEIKFTDVVDILVTFV